MPQKIHTISLRVSDSWRARVEQACRDESAKLPVGFNRSTFIVHIVNEWLAANGYPDIQKEGQRDAW